MIDHSHPLLHVYGASDDLIELDGYFSEEFSAYCDDSAKWLAFSDGTVLTVRYDGDWRFDVKVKGPLYVETMRVEDNLDEDCYTDHVYFAQGILWVALIDQWYEVK